MYDIVCKSVIIRRFDKQKAILTSAYAGEGCVQLSMSKRMSAKVDDGSRKSEPLETVEGAGIRELYRPAGRWWSEEEGDARDTVDFIATEQTDLDEVAMQPCDLCARVMHQALFDGEITENGTDATHFEIKAVWWNAGVSEHAEQLWRVL